MFVRDKMLITVIGDLNNAKYHDHPPYLLSDSYFSMLGFLHCLCTLQNYMHTCTCI